MIKWWIRTKEGESSFHVKDTNQYHGKTNIPYINSVKVCCIIKKELLVHPHTLGVVITLKGDHKAAMAHGALQLIRSELGQSTVSSLH